MNNKFDNINKIICKRSRIINFKLLFLFIAKKLSCYSSYSKILSLFSLDFVPFTKTAIINKRKNIPSSIFYDLNNDFINFVYNSIGNKPRIVAIDGTQVNLPYPLRLEGFPLSANKSMCIGKISALYDIENNLIINYTFDKDFNERNYYKRQLKFLNKGDIILADRGYYSEELLEMTYKLGINCVFRLRKDLKIVKKLIDSKRKRIVVNVRNTKLHVISYNVEIKEKLTGEKSYKTYYIGTTLSRKKYGIEYIKEIYRRRWGVETSIRYSKYVEGLNKLNSKCKNFVEQDIGVIQLISNLSLYNELLLGTHYNNAEKKINHGSNSKLTIEKMIQAIFYEKNYKNIITNIYLILLKNLIPIIKNRSYERVSKQPRSRWTFSCKRHKQS